MKLIAGLGNPGDRYAETRHNIGFMVAQRLAEIAGISLKKKGYQGVYGSGRCAGQEVTILLPQTFMNLSGASVGSAFRSLGISPGDLIVIHDEIDLPFGTIRVKDGGGHGGHNGLRSICEVIGDPGYIRLRAGVGRPEGERDVSAHVLSRFSSEERKVLDTYLDNAARAIESILDAGVQTAMNEYNNQDLTT